MAIEHLQCRAPRCRRMMLEGLLPRPSADAIADADDLDRKKGSQSARKPASLSDSTRRPQFDRFGNPVERRV